MIFILMGLLVFSSISADAAPHRYVVDQVLDVGPVWAGHPVGFALLTHGDILFAAFYDDQRRMTVASRKLSEDHWKFVRLPSSVGWDSHNYIAMTIDDAGFVHVSGNMHVASLVYFRTTKPLDITTFAPAAMVGRDETHVTYPDFFRGPGGELIFGYRDGHSGDGNQIYNVYDVKTQNWHRLLNHPLTDGQGHRNAYLTEPMSGPDGYWHIVWVWRESYLVETCHDPSYARSRDLVHWEKSDGSPLALPITLDTGEVIDPVSQHGGIVNGLVKLGFDSKNRPMISYSKYDAAGNTQIYVARKESAGWKLYQVTDWNWRWDFGGGGSIPFALSIGGVELRPDGSLTLAYSSKDHGSATWILDPQTLKPIGQASGGIGLPAELSALTSSFPGMSVRRQWDTGEGKEKGVRYMMRWETLGPNRDRPRSGSLPASSLLQVYKLRDPGQ